MRALMTATVPSMIGQFNINNIKLLIELGYKVDVACNFNDRSVWSDKKIKEFKETLKDLKVSFYQIDFERSIIKFNNHIKSYKQIKKLMNQKQYSLIHTHTPVSSLITRIAFKNSQIYNHCKMIYTAHGFHFFKGNNPLKNILFKNIEKYGAKYTDVLITINKEDYKAAKKFKLKKNGKIEYVPGVGINIEEIDLVKGDKVTLCKELLIPDKSILLLSVGELNDNKNHRVIIEALPTLPSNIHYLICGTGVLESEYLSLAKNNKVENRLHILGYRNDIIRLMKSCDIFVFPSKREGLSVALMEAMACGLPCIVSDIRGNNDLINNEKNGFRLKKIDSCNVTEKIYKLINDQELYTFMKRNNIETIKKNSISNISKLMNNIYSNK